MVVLVTCKNDEDPYKNESTRVECSQHFSHYKPIGIFRILNLSEILWLYSLPARMKKIQSKMEELECSQNFPHYNPMGAICYHGNQSSDQIWQKKKKNLMKPFTHPSDTSDEI